MANLEWYDGPLLDLVKDLSTGTAVLVLWLDCDETSNLWAYLWLTTERQADLLDSRASLYDLVSEATRVVVFRTESTVEPLDIREIDLALLMDACGPKPSGVLAIAEEGRAAIEAAFTRSNS